MKKVQVLKYLSLIVQNNGEYGKEVKKEGLDGEYLQLSLTEE